MVDAVASIVGGAEDCIHPDMIALCSYSGKHFCIHILGGAAGVGSRGGIVSMVVVGLGLGCIIGGFVDAAG